MPPEINSGRMYTGPGSGSMMAAAAAWDGLAAELGSTASGYASVVTELTGAPWLGPASRSMVAAATPYVAWLSSAATLAEEAGSRARAAAAAFETAFAMTVPPPVVAANRALTAALVATNFFGQNAPAIAAAEAQYAEMWAQDATAMYGYAGASAVAARLNPFTEPGPTAQAAAVNQAAVPEAVSTTSIFAPISQALQQLSTASFASGLNPTQWWIAQQFADLSAANRTALSRATVGFGSYSAGIVSFFGSIAQQSTTGFGSTAGAGGAWYATPEFVGLGLRGVAGDAMSSAPTAASAPTVSASAMSAAKVGGLTVPTGWGSSPSVLEDATAQAIAVDCTTGPDAGPTGVFRGVPASPGGRRARAHWPPREYGFKHSVLARPPSAG